MKSIKKVVLTFLLFSGCLLVACDIIGTDCSCPEIDGAFFDVNGLNLVPRINAQMPLGAGAEIEFDDFAFYHADFLVDYVAARTVTPAATKWRNAAWACSCVSNGLFGAKNEIIEYFEVITLNDYDDAHKSGANINNLLVMESQSFGTPLNDFLQDTEGELIQFEDFFLSLTHAPTINSEVKFMVLMKLTNGEEYEAESVPIIFK